MFLSLPLVCQEFGFLVRVSLGHSQGPFTSGGSGYETQYTEESKATLRCNHLWTNEAKKLNPER